MKSVKLDSDRGAVEVAIPIGVLDCPVSCRSPIHDTAMICHGNRFVCDLLRETAMLRPKTEYSGPNKKTLALTHKLID